MCFSPLLLTSFHSSHGLNSEKCLFDNFLIKKSGSVLLQRIELERVNLDLTLEFICKRKACNCLIFPRMLPVVTLCLVFSLKMRG